MKINYYCINGTPEKGFDDTDDLNNKIKLFKAVCTFGKCL